MPYYVYILYSKSKQSYYKGQTNDIESRIARHNKGLEKATREGRPWKLLWSTEKENRKAAMELEREIKNLTKERLVNFIKKYSSGVVGHDDTDRSVSKS